MQELCFVNLSCVRELMSVIVGSEVGSGRLLQFFQGLVLMVTADFVSDSSVDSSLGLVELRCVAG